MSGNVRSQVKELLCRVQGIAFDRDQFVRNQLTDEHGVTEEDDEGGRLYLSSTTDFPLSLSILPACGGI